jgi:phenylalanyl-tRNA synthetase beta subunit
MTWRPCSTGARLTHGRRRAHVLLDGSYQVGRTGEITGWLNATDFEAAVCAAELLLRTIPDIGPLEW